MSSGFIVPKIRNFVCSWGFWPCSYFTFIIIIAWTVKWFNATQGPFTIFFWCPLAKWMISIQNIKDIQHKPLEQVNPIQQCVILVTGILFAKWALIITPANIYLCACNATMACTGVIQLYRKQMAGQLL